MPIITVTIAGLFTFAGVLIGLEYKRRSKNKQLKHDKSQATKNHQRELEKMLIEKFLSNYDFSNFNVEDLKDLSDSLSVTFSAMKENVNNDSTPIVQTLVFSSFNKDGNKNSRVEKLQKIKEKNNNVNNKDNTEELNPEVEVANITNI